MYHDTRLPRCPQVDVRAHRIYRTSRTAAFTDICTRFDFLHLAGINYQATDALFQLSTTVINESPLEDDLQLYTIDSVNGRHTLAHTVTYDRDLSRPIPNTNTSASKSKHISPTNIDLKRTPQQGTSFPAAAARLDRPTAKLWKIKKACWR